ncbi:MAG TPA: heme o synthase [Candidatus Dormibacteraeota bacterium]|nr:heme o synthase [Candidatus Dormibacteraeota bacterium]
MSCTVEGGPPVPPVVTGRPARSGISIAGTAAVVVDHLALLKPRVIGLLAFTAVCTMVVAAHGWPPIGLVLATLLGGALSAGGANALNNWVDADIDGVMSRTRSRPLPAGRIPRRRSLLVGVALGAGGFAVLLAWTTWLAAVLSLLALLVYVLVYTLWLKRSTPQNIVIGGVAGALPPLVGWAAVTGRLGPTALIVFAVVLVWTPPHFWSLALLMREDYARARVPMLPVVRGGAVTRRWILGYTAVLVPVTLAPVAAGAMGAGYAAAALVLGAGFLWQAVRLLREATAAAGLRCYLYSLLYLAGLFAAMAVDRLVR